jgi:putative tryptophan/tyrosine transport system substrate-binding protein
MKRRAFMALLSGSALCAINARAQNSMQMRRLSVVMSTDEGDSDELSTMNAVVETLAKHGWTAGENLQVRYWWGSGDRDRMLANAREAVAFKPDALLVKGANLPAVQGATSSIPIIFVVLSDAVAERYVGNFARPTGNITGFTSDERALVGKRLTLLRGISPLTRRVLYVRSRAVGTDTDALYASFVKDAEALDLGVIDGASDDEVGIERNIELFASDRGGALLAAFDAFVTMHRGKLVELTARYRLPAIYPLPAFVRGGGLLSYGFDQEDQFRQAASYVSRVLSGEKPGDLPVQTPTKFKMVVNLKTAKTLGLDIPSSILAVADEVIE